MDEAVARLQRITRRFAWDNLNNLRHCTLLRQTGVGNGPGTDEWHSWAAAFCSKFAGFIRRGFRSF